MLRLKKPNLPIKEKMCCKTFVADLWIINCDPKSVLRFVVFSGVIFAQPDPTAPRQHFLIKWNLKEALRWESDESKQLLDKICNKWLSLYAEAYTFFRSRQLKILSLSLLSRKYPHLIVSNECIRSNNIHTWT